VFSKEKKLMNFSIFQWRSIKTRVTIFTLTFFLIGIWMLTFYSNYTLKKDMEQTLGEQQFSTVSIIAAEINTGLDDRIKALEKVAALITPVMLGNAATMQKFVEGSVVLPMMFNGGFFVLLPDGTAIADYPLSTGRRGVNFMDRKYAIGALKEGKTTTGNPVMGKALRSTLFSIATPIYNTKGEVIGALAGTVDLAKPNFISRITDNSYGKTGDYLLVAPETRTIVYATDKKRIMEVLPGPGFNPLIDRAIKGWEGSGITIRPSNGVQILSSVKYIPVSGWYAVAMMPTAEAFAPISAMQQRMLLAAIFLTLLAGFLTWWMLKRQLAPVFSTIKTLAALSDTDHPPQPLPIIRQDEIGELISGFNHLLETLGQREETLKESEEKFSKAFQTSPYAITITRPEDGTFIEVNDAFTSMTGFTREEGIASSSIGLKMWVNKEDRQSVVAALSKGQAVVGKECQFLTKTGKVIIGLISAQTIHLGHGPFILSSINDITSRKQAEEALKESEERYRTVIEHSNDGIALMREDVHIFVNKRFAEIFGYSSPEEITGKSHKSTVHPDDLERLIDINRKRQANTAVPSIYEFKGIRKDGGIVYIEASAVMIMYCSEPHTLAYLRDVTGHKHLESQLLQSQKMEAIGTLAGGVAHDFNNILTAIMGFGSLLLMDMQEDDPKKVFVDQILISSEKAADLTHSLLAFSRKQQIALKPLDINNSVKDTSELLKRLLTEDIELKKRLSKETLVIMGDATQIDQILINLAVNAHDAMPMGGTLSIETAMVTLDNEFIRMHGYGEPGMYVSLSVSDTGTGMDEATKARIFDPFFTTKEVGKGTGLGLATVYGIVKQHNGYITVDSEPNQGTTFRIYLPAAMAKVDKEQQETAPAILMGKERILIAEDNEEVRRFMREALQQYGYKIIEAIDGEDAVDKFKQHLDIDLIVVDSVMPKKNGREVYEEIHGINPHIKTLFMSGHTKDIVLNKGIKDKEFNFIAKPLSLNGLLQKVREVLDR
jgi:PAS domain S-box-containing protein